MLRRLALLLFVGAAILATLVAGMYVQAAKILPPALRSVHQTLAATLDFWGLTQPLDSGIRLAAPPPGPGVVECGPDASLRQLRAASGMRMLLCPAADVGRTEAAAARIATGEGLADPVLFKGEVGTFLDQCPPPWGCAAVEYSRAGVVRRSWPLRLEAIAAANIAPESRYPYFHPIGWSLPRAVRRSLFRISPYPNGDLLVVFDFRNSTPYGGGVARLAPDGSPRWYRKDYSHHWPHVVDDDLALVPGWRPLRRTRVFLPVVAHGRRVELRCEDSFILEDLVHVLDGQGALVEEIPVLDAIARSRHVGILDEAPDCDPTHLNFVHMLGADAGGAPGIAPGDLVVSLRNLSAFGILDRDSRRLKRLIRGSFHRQHGVRHLAEARFLVFDNLGAGPVHGPSRLLAVDLATGEERTVFPNDATPAHLRRYFYYYRGQFDISPDRRRVLLSDRAAGRAFEIRLADGEVLNAFHQIHDVSGQPGIPAELAGNAWLFSFPGIHYAKGPP